MCVCVCVCGVCVCGFSKEKWKNLSLVEQQSHTLADCNIFYIAITRTCMVLDFRIPMKIVIFVA